MATTKVSKNITIGRVGVRERGMKEEKFVGRTRGSIEAYLE